jgi:hypothetical protein
VSAHANPVAEWIEWLEENTYESRLWDGAEIGLTRAELAQDLSDGPPAGRGNRERRIESPLGCSFCRPHRGCNRD